MSGFTEFEVAFGHEQVVIDHDPGLGYTAVVAVHSTVLGPAEGGLRVQKYDSTLSAILDALRLSAAMTLKTSAAGLPLGGGKAVMIQPPPDADRRAIMHALGETVNRLEGRFVVAEDVGTSPEDMDWISERTGWVAGVSPSRGGMGDPSPSTAKTVYGALRAALASLGGVDDLAGKTVGIVGVGKVGSSLAKLVADAGARVIVTDRSATRAAQIARETGGEVASAEGFLESPFDVIAPCAGGQVFSRSVVARLRCRVVVGAANNQLVDDDAALALHERGILYVPDFIANCGGVIHNAAEYLKKEPAQIDADLQTAVARCAHILREANAAGALPLDVARHLAQSRIDNARPTNQATTM